MFWLLLTNAEVIRVLSVCREYRIPPQKRLAHSGRTGTETISELQRVRKCLNRRGTSCSSSS